MVERSVHIGKVVGSIPTRRTIVQWLPARTSRVPFGSGGEHAIHIRKVIGSLPDWMPSHSGGESYRVHRDILCILDSRAILVGMKKWLAVALLCTLVLISVGSVIYSATFEHMTSQNACVFSFGGISQCITNIIGSLFLAQNAIPAVITFLSTLVLFSVIAVLSVLLFQFIPHLRHRLLELFSSPYNQRLTRWLSLHEQSPSTL